MRQIRQHRQPLQHLCDTGSYDETSNADFRQRRCDRAPALRPALTPAAQGHTAAAASVATAAGLSSRHHCVDTSASPLGTPVVFRQHFLRGRDGGLRGPRSSGDRLGFPRRIPRIRPISLRPSSQGGVAVVGPVPAAAASCISADRPSRADAISTVLVRGRR